MRELVLRYRDQISGLVNLGGSRLLLTGMSFLSSVLIARQLGAEQLGMFALITGAFAYVSIIAEFGLRSTVTAESARLGDVASVLPTYIWLRTIISLVVYAATMAGTWFFFRTYLLPTALIMLSILFFAWQIDWVLLVRQKYRAAAWTGMIRWLAYLVSIVICIQFWQLDLVLLSQLFLYSWIAGAVFSWLVVRRNGGSSLQYRGGHAPDAAGMLRTGAPILGATLVSQVLQNADLLWVGRAFGAADAAHYYLATSIVSASLVFANALGQMATVQYAACRGVPEKMESRLKSDTRLIIIVACMISLALYLAAPLAAFIFGEGYYSVVELVRRLVPYAVLYHAWSLCFYILVALGLERSLFIGNLVAGIAAIPIFWIATIIGGVHELAFAKGFVLFASTLLMYLIAPTHLRRPFAYILAPAAVMALIAAAFSGFCCESSMQLVSRLPT